MPQILFPLISQIFAETAVNCGSSAVFCVFCGKYFIANIVYVFFAMLNVTPIFFMGTMKKITNVYLNVVKEQEFELYKAG